MTIEEKIKEASEFPGKKIQIKIRLVNKLSGWGNCAFAEDYREHVQPGQIMWACISDKYKFETVGHYVIHPSDNVFASNFTTSQFEVLGVYNSANIKTHYHDAKRNKFLEYVTSPIDEIEDLEVNTTKHKRLGIPLIPEGLDVHLFSCNTDIYEDAIGFGIKKRSTVWVAYGHVKGGIIKLFNDVHSYNFPTRLFTYLGCGVGRGGDAAIEELSDKIETQTAETIEMSLEQISQLNRQTKEVFPVEKIKEQLEELKKLPLIPEDCFKTPNDTDVSTMKNIEI